MDLKTFKRKVKEDIMGRISKNNPSGKIDHRRSNKKFAKIDIKKNNSKSGEAH